MKKTSLIIAFAFINAIGFSQKERTQTFGQKNLNELQMTSYPKDTLAPALVLFDQANYYLDESSDFSLVTDYYNRIKIFDKNKGQKYTNIVIYTRKKDLVKNIKGVTYNLQNGSITTTSIDKANVFTTPYSKDYNKTTFTLPNIKDGSVIEYSYKIVLNTLQIRDWYYQSDIPKLKSRYDLAIMGNYQYNTRLVGFYSLDTNESKVVDECLPYPDEDDGLRRKKIPCAWYSYGMDSVPALKEEAYMLSPRNYLSRISLDLKSITTITQKSGVSHYDSGVKKSVKNYTKTWKDADKTLKVDFLNNQGTKKSFFKKKLSGEILEEVDQLKKAKSIYNFIQNHYTWNEKNWISSNIDVKETFQARTGSVDEINLSLYNSLQAAKIESYITLVSTRNNGIPTKLFPTLTDFNYLIVKVVINGKEYFLDATNKNLPFGLIPFKCLNGEARVFDFKNGSYWQNLKVTKPSVKRITNKITVDKDGYIKSTISTVNTGYYANNIRNVIDNSNKDNYIESKEKALLDSEYEKYEIENLDTKNKPVVEKMETISDEAFNQSFKLYPIHFRTSVNPFKLNERLYPVDYGYKRSISERISIVIPDNFKFTNIPKETGFKLPNAAGSFLFKVQQKGNTLNLFLKTQFSKSVYTSNEYFYLKKFYDEIIKVHSSYINIEKK